MITWTFSMLLSLGIYLLGICTGILWLRWKLAKIEESNLKLSRDRLEKIKLMLSRKSTFTTYKKSRRRKKFVPSPIYDNNKLKSEIEDLLKDIHCK